MPWLAHNVLALHLSGGTSAGGYPGQGEFYVGGFQDVGIVDTLRNQTTQGGIVLRGYPVVEETGPNYALINAEYRFPILNVDRGVSTYPIFLNRFYGTVFSDFGSAFSAPATADWKLGSGAGRCGWISRSGSSKRSRSVSGTRTGWSTGRDRQVLLVSAVQF